ncbi:2-dehydro-3-deoxygalactonokinase [Roseovarius ramblicola]|uniref:2-dehydro-3-deoxygalactonokinase n=1 Tax=Roseovarius ramblicola TaxID=2022336 RepID=A0ABV5HV58_9RHOB
MSRWRLCGHDGAEGRAMALDGGHILGETNSETADTALVALDATGPVLRIGDGTATVLPAAPLPDTVGSGLPGLIQDSPPDCLDGWTRLLLIGLKDHDGIACVLTPTLAHWVHLSAGEAVSCLSFLTPRLATALGAAAEADADALADTLSRPERLAAHLRAAEVQGARAALTGHLLGAELAAARPYWLGQNVALIGPQAAVGARATALVAQGVPVSRHDPDSLLPAAIAALAARRGSPG